ncbi:type II toxin-antitoxin system tRNA(fMet)-specific endonuclease VapC [Parvibium lacunae]|uniref:Ribonuclease VapC n=1 Tax=Parvibium lacunae TaxID=1888893 RepID=A0A368L5D8_9BURK|nr:type II toxin-antitoxin system VapC family toxin [Parvibium lacunae]RCS58632.1 type II toxin-antitoxin system VapC family toxin [Parvibium lacunae]
MPASRALPKTNKARAVRESQATYLSSEPPKQLRYLLDTNICIYIAKHAPVSVRERFAEHTAAELAMSVITYGELCFGVQKSVAKSKAQHLLAQLNQTIEVCPLPDHAGEHYGDIRAHLEKKGQVIGNNDLWIAAHARANGWILVTNNEKEFKRVPKLQIENWV